jgi:hypothetical protein
LGQERTLSRLRSMSAIPLKAGIAERGQNVRMVPATEVEGLLAPKPLLPPQQLRDAAGAPDEPIAAAPASPSTEETMSQQVGARGNDRGQHQLFKCLRCNFIAHLLSDAHAEYDWQHRSRRN